MNSQVKFFKLKKEEDRYSFNSMKILSNQEKGFQGLTHGSED
jgi:hypothetical protein